jgi:hypothetical protein
MISQYELPALLRKEIPALALKNYPRKISLEIYSSINYFIEYTGEAVQENNVTMARKCFCLAENLYRDGDRMVKLLIENSFIHAMDAYLPTDALERKALKIIIPDKLYALYIHQAMSSGI